MNKANKIVTVPNAVIGLMFAISISYIQIFKTTTIQSLFIMIMYILFAFSIFMLAKNSDIQIKKILDESSKKLEQLEERMRNSISIDEETGALKQSAFLDEVARMTDTSRRTEVPFCLLVMQCTNSKDRDNKNVLKEVIDHLKTRLRVSDRIGIVQGNIIAILLNNVQIDDANDLCSQLIDWFELESEIYLAGGLSEVVQNRDKPDSLLKRALQALDVAIEREYDRIEGQKILGQGRSSK